CIAVDEKGNVVDGDSIIYILAKRLKDKKNLNRDTVAVTVMSNSGFFKSLAEIGIKSDITPVGDRFVYECMQRNDYDIGGEQSGHIIIKKYATTGDGILTALMIAEEMCDSKSSLSKLASPVRRYPQHQISIKVKDKSAAISDEGVLLKKCDAEKIISGKGRVVLRKSGTEPVIRVMVECEDMGLCEELCESIAEAIRKGGHSVE
ncbi:MAG: phosphoglucosamine mutase, partial [Clostridia bacterium]|nr:phosphoglucosamine mutase [Clostridia bacterium]